MFLLNFKLTSNRKSYTQLPIETHKKKASTKKPHRNSDDNKNSSRKFFFVACKYLCAVDKFLQKKRCETYQEFVWRFLFDFATATGIFFLVFIKFVPQKNLNIFFIFIKFNCQHFISYIRRCSAADYNDAQNRT